MVMCSALFPTLVPARRPPQAPSPPVHGDLHLILLPDTAGRAVRAAQALLCCPDNPGYGLIVPILSTAARPWSTRRCRPFVAPPLRSSCRSTPAAPVAHSRSSSANTTAYSGNCPESASRPPPAERAHRCSC